MKEFFFPATMFSLGFNLSYATHESYWGPLIAAGQGTAFLLLCAAILLSKGRT